MDGYGLVGGQGNCRKGRSIYDGYIFIYFLSSRVIA